ncbi:MAG: enoyl-ACP reductase, partial [Gemmataceae bacterium]
MIPIDLSGKVALVTGVGDDKSFAWFISKALQAAGARLILAVHPRMLRIVEGFLNGTSPDDMASKKLPFGDGYLSAERVLPCDVSYDTMDDVPDSVRTDRRFKRIEDEFGDYSIGGMMAKIAESYKQIDMLIHAIAFSAEIRNKAIDTSRNAHLQAISI